MNFAQIRFIGKAERKGTYKFFKFLNVQFKTSTVLFAVMTVLNCYLSDFAYIVLHNSVPTELAQ